MANRAFNLPLAELLDRLSVDQIKEVLWTDGGAAIRDEMRKLQSDIDVIICEKQIPLSAALLRAVIALAQINLHIWGQKDTMEQLRDSDPKSYAEYMIRSHQLNGVRNQIKNRILELTNDLDGASKRSNFSTDGLEGWKMSL